MAETIVTTITLYFDSLNDSPYLPLHDGTSIVEKHTSPKLYCPFSPGFATGCLTTTVGMDLDRDLDDG